MSDYTMSDFRAEMRRRKHGEHYGPREQREEKRTTEPAVASLVNASIKRLAWAFGCAKRNSEEESNLYRLLVEKVAAILEARK